MNNTKVEIVFHRGEIAAQIPPELSERLRGLHLGRYEPRWNAWRFPSGPYVAYQLIRIYRNEIIYLDPQVKELAKSYHFAHEAKNDKAAISETIPRLKTRSWSHQTRAYNFALHLPAAALIMAMGTGKSLTSIGIISNREHDTTLIVAPKSVISVWPTEFSRHAALDFRISAPVKGSVKGRVRVAQQDLNHAKAWGKPYVLVVNYESFWREAFADFILNIDWDNVIFDELHRIKSPQGKASRFAAKLVERSKYRLGLTGTLLPHSPLDAFASYRALSKDVFGSNYFRFKNRYAIMGGFNNKQVVGYQNREELHEKIEALAIQVKNDVLELPEAIHNYRCAPLEPKTRKIYEQLESEFYAEVEDQEITVANAMVKVLRLQQLTSGYLKTDDDELIEYGTEKRKLFADLLEEIPQDEPVVAFARFTADIANIKAAAAKAGRTCAELSGKANELKAWQDGEYDVLAVQVKSGGVGIDLTRAAYCVYYSIGHSLGDYEQSLARTLRPGQERTVRYYHLLAEDTVDEKIYKALQARKEVVEYILEGIAARRLSPKTGHESHTTQKMQ